MSAMNWWIHSSMNSCKEKKNGQWKSKFSRCCQANQMKVVACMKYTINREVNIKVEDGCIRKDLHIYKEILRMEIYFKT
jgi:hypothetical protein